MKSPSEIKHNSHTSSRLPGPDDRGDLRRTFGATKLLMLLVGLIGLSGLALLPFTVFRISREMVAPAAHDPINVTSGDELISMLKEKGLWEITGNFAVPRFILSSYPANIGKLETEAKKKAFFNSLLPAALMAMGEVEKERQTLYAVLAKIPRDHRLVRLSEPLDRWAGTLSKTEIDAVMALGLKYRTDLAWELVKRVDVVPLSLLLAQAALESSWGSSRIAREGNNLFGVVTWGENAVDPPVGSDGTGQRYASYDSILESVRAYIVMLNRLPSYEHFREIRSRNRNPLALAEGLGNYSERREAYISDLKEVMLGNDLSLYDGYFLALPPLPQPRGQGLWEALVEQFDWTHQPTAV